MNATSIPRGQPTTSTLVAGVYAAASQLYAATPNTRHPNHRPQTSIPEGQETFYVLTLLTDGAHHQAMCALRERYYPPALLRVSAHISLFRALPGSLIPALRADVAAVAARTASIGICAVGPPIQMGRGGVGVLVTGLQPVDGIMRELQEKWHDVLSRQDRGRFRGHYTLMNKVNDNEKVKRCLENVGKELGPWGCPGIALGLSLWRYDAGWWRHEEDFTFSKVCLEVNDK
ncbi:hypothetical protein F4819DRAFT_498292 [Hypoxylon fuscum]|nr:hypothetical protein F4819DRAFT_498292 [Hypoxylon fuscum]